MVLVGPLHFECIHYSSNQYLFVSFKAFIKILLHRIKSIFQVTSFPQTKHKSVISHYPVAQALTRAVLTLRALFCLSCFESRTPVLWDANWPVSNRIGHSCRCHGLLLRFSEDLVLSHHHWQCHCRHWCSCCWLSVFSLLLLCCVSVVTYFLLTNTSGPLPNPSRAKLFFGGSEGLSPKLLNTENLQACPAHIIEI